MVKRLSAPNEIYISPTAPTDKSVLWIDSDEEIPVSFTRVIHGTVASTARPTANYVEWVGSVEPTNAINNDSWIQTP